MTGKLYSDGNDESAKQLPKLKLTLALLLDSFYFGIENRNRNVVSVQSFNNCQTQLLYL